MYSYIIVKLYPLRSRLKNIYNFCDRLEQTIIPMIILLPIRKRTKELKTEKSLEKILEQFIADPPASDYLFEGGRSMHELRNVSSGRVRVDDWQDEK